MKVAKGSHKLGEKLPVEFGDGSSFMHDERPGIGEVREPEDGRARSRRLSAQGRRVRLPRRADLARVGPEHEPEPAPRLHPALRRRRDDLARSARFPYNYTDEELECMPGEPIHGPHFPQIETAFSPPPPRGLDGAAVRRRVTRP